jgi:hypothetical protein
LLGCVSFAGDPIGYTRVLGLVSFDCHPGSPFFSDQIRTLLLLIYVFSFRHHSLSLSPQKATTVPTTTLALSPQKVTRSISLLRCPRKHVPFAAANCAHSEDHTYFLSLESWRYSRPAGQPHARRRKGPANVNRDVIQSRRLSVPSPWGSVPSSVLSLRPRCYLRSSSLAALAS